MFDAKISETEMIVLAAIRERAEKFGPAGKMDYKPIREDIGLSPEDFERAISYLAEHNLIGAKFADTSSNEGWSSLLVNVWLTGIGENYMRTIESAPGVGQRLTVATVRASWSIIHDFAVSVLTELAVAALRRT